MMSLFNLGITLLSFMIGYFVYSWAIKIGFLNTQVINSNEFSVTSVDFIWLFLVLLTGFFFLLSSPLNMENAIHSQLVI